jgi:hypothetical protein
MMNRYIELDQRRAMTCCHPRVGSQYIRLLPARPVAVDRQKWPKSEIHIPTVAATSTTIGMTLSPPVIASHAIQLQICSMLRTIELQAALPILRHALRQPFC